MPEVREHVGKGFPDQRVIVDNQYFHGSFLAIRGPQCSDHSGSRPFAANA
jgi:hypothetical protein